MSRCIYISSPPARPRGFTLVELLVALGLVALILLLFAQIFTIASGTMSTQRGIMENDQRARMLTTIITSDLKNRTMRSVMPFQPGEQDAPTASYYSFSQRLGFLSISENDPNNDADDVLHLTTFFSPQTSDDQTSSDADVYYGKATPLYPVSTFPAGATAAQLAAFYSSTIENNPNQPEADDGSTFANSTASSHMAEVVFFLRNGNLYRRVLLIREPLDQGDDREPKDNFTGTGYDMFIPTAPPPPTPPSPPSTYYPFGNDFWRDFDFSAHLESYTSGARFTGSGTGVNPIDNGTKGGNFPIGKPFNRFGHDPEITNPNLGPDNTFKSTDDSVGNPREYVGTLFIGRFTQQETSHSAFNYPHSASSLADDHDPVTGIPSAFINDGIPPKFLPNIDPSAMPGDANPPTVAIVNALTDANGDNIIDQYSSNPAAGRRGEDLLMSNVHSFDVKVWDEIIGDYVDVGHSRTIAGNPVGDFNQVNNRRTSYGPQTSNNRMFDTWHPQFDANNYSFYLDALGNPVSMDTGDVPPFLPRVDPSTYPVWQANHAYAIGEIVVPSDTVGHYFDTVYYYQCTANTTGMATGQSGTTEPSPWPAANGITVTDNQLTWTAIYNNQGIKDVIKRLRSLKITIRYLDVSSDQMRQVTLIQSLID